MLSKRFVFITALFMGHGTIASTEQPVSAPMSAIDWLSDSVAKPVVLKPNKIAPNTSETAVTNSASVEGITVTTLDGQPQMRLGCCRFQ